MFGDSAVAETAFAEPLEEEEDALFQNQLHQIEDGLVLVTAVGLNGVLIT